MQEDEKLRQWLCADAPAARDAHFRIAVLERRTRQRYQRRQRLLLAGTVVLAVVGSIALHFIANRGNALLSADVLQPVLAVLFFLALVVAGLTSARGLWQVLRQLRGR